VDRGQRVGVRVAVGGEDQVVLGQHPVGLVRGRT
jgi:hypothetical protein